MSDNQIIDMPNGAKAQDDEAFEIDLKATVDWFDAEGEVEYTQRICRSAYAVHDWLNDKLLKNPQQADQRMRIYLRAPTSASEEEKAQNFQITLAEGTLKDCEEKMRSARVTAVESMTKIQELVMRLCEVSSLKGILVTGVFGDAQIGGFSVLTESCEVTESDILVLNKAAEGQLDMFRNAMRTTKDIQFPDDDDSGIIIPGRR